LLGNFESWGKIATFAIRFVRSVGVPQQVAKLQQAERNDGPNCRGVRADDIPLQLAQAEADERRQLEPGWGWKSRLGQRKTAGRTGPVPK
jgi:hypothetical protein